MEHPTTDIFVELHVPDFQIAIDFYRQLGFAIAARQAEYLVLRKGKSQFNFYKGTEAVYEHSYFGQFPKSTKRGYAVELILFEDQLDELFARIKDTVNIAAPIKLKPWGKRDFRIVDPFGFYLRISEPYNWA